MSSVTRKVDARARVILPEEFAGRLVTVEVADGPEVRIRLAKAPRPRPSLAALLAGVTRANLPEKVEFGPPAGREVV